MRCRPCGSQPMPTQTSVGRAHAPCLRAFQATKKTRNVCGMSLARRPAGNTGRALRLDVVAFREGSDRKTPSAPTSRGMSTGEHVSVSVDYYRLLQVPRVSRPDAIRKSYEQLMKQAPATAYSADTLFARAVLLKAAAESLTDPDLRRSYDAKLAAGHSSLRVSQQDLPGALVVLQEIGEFQLVIDLGTRWLEPNGGQPDAGDVAAAVALSYCDRAGERLTSPDSQGAVLPACDDLDAALVKLRRYNVSQQLQSQIVSALRDLAPEYACELAALPLGPENGARRAKGVALMRGVLRSAAATVSRSGGLEADADMIGSDEDPRSVVSHARRMLQRGRDILTCGEQVSLLPNALRGSGLSPHPDVLYDGALAHIVDGFRNGWPHSIHSADRLLVQLDQIVQRQAAVQREKEDLAAAAAARRVHYNGATAASSPGVYHYVDAEAEAEKQQQGGGAGGMHLGGVALERAVCAVLLADYAAATSLLGMDDSLDGAGQGADAQLRSFIMEHASNGTNDMRPGLRAMASRWLEGVALVSFRDTAGQPVMPLDKIWFTDPRVAAYIQVWRVSRNDHVLAAAHFLCNLLPNILKFLADLTVKAATAAALVASRAQRLSMAVATVAAAATAKRGSGCSTAAAGRQRPPSAITNNTLGPSTRAPSAAAAPPAGAAAAPAAPSVSSEAPTVSGRGPAGATPSPFGHPYGKTLREAPGELAAGHPGARDTNTGAGRMIFARAPVSASTSALPASASGNPGLLADGSSSAPSDLRRRFAASAAVDAAVTAPPQNEDNTGHRLDAGDGHYDDGVDDTLDEHPADEEVAPRKGMTEQDLRAHLAGLEAAMWDSELPERGMTPKKLIMLGAAAVTILAALLMFVLRRPDGQSARMQSTPPAVVSITVSAFVSPN